MKKLLSLLLCLAMVLSLTACGQSGETQPAVSETVIPETSAPETTIPAGHYPITVTDQAGREVTIEQAPERLVSGYYISTSALIALDLEDRLVGIEAKADKRAIYRLSAPELIDLPNVGTAKEFDLEGCAALEPDLVILPLKLKDAAKTLEDLGFPVLLVNPEDQAQLEEMISLIAAANVFNTISTNISLRRREFAGGSAGKDPGRHPDPQCVPGGQLRAALHRRGRHVPVRHDPFGRGRQCGGGAHRYLLGGDQL